MGGGGTHDALPADAKLHTFHSVSPATGLQTTSIVIATMSGAILWIAFATFKGLPVSTTHAIVGAITAVAIFSGGFHQVDWTVLAGRIGIPMLVSPIVALVLTSGILKTWRALAPVMSTDCLCVESESELEGLSSR